MSYIIQNVLLTQQSRNRLMFVNRLNSLEEDERKKDGPPCKATLETTQENGESEDHEDDERKATPPQTKTVSTLLRDYFQGFMDNYATVFRDITIVLLYFVLGVIFYRFYEGWGLIKCLYFIVVSMTTVGYGDVYPTDDVSRLVTIVYIFLGLVFIFAIMNDAIQTFLKHIEEKTTDGVNIRKKHRRKIIISVIIIILFLLLGTLFFTYNEGWSFTEALFWTFSTVMTVGYGDKNLEQDSSRLFSIFYILFAVILMTTSLGNFAVVKAESELERHKVEMLSRPLDIEAIRRMDVDGGGVDEIEFVTAMLVQICGLDKEKDIDPWRKRFRELDKDNSGALDEEDLQILEREEKARRLSLLQAMGEGSVSDCNAASDKSTLMWMWDRLMNILGWRTESYSVRKQKVSVVQVRAKVHPMERKGDDEDQDDGRDVGWCRQTQDSNGTRSSRDDEYSPV